MAKLNSGTRIYGTATVDSTLTVAAGTVAAPAITTSGDTNTGIFFPAADTIAFGEGGAEAVRIDSSGRVGIGTTSPAAPLDIVSDSSANTIKLRGRSADNISSFRAYSNDGVTQYAVLRLASDETRLNSVTAIPLTFGTTNTERMRIDSSGNVGIGTASPGTLLQVAGIIKSGVTGTNGHLQLARTSDGATITNFLTDGTSGIINSVISTIFQENTTERMRIASGGNVGIGTSSPSQKLEIYAAANSLQIESVVRNDQAGSGVAAIGFNVSSGAAAETTSTKAGIGLVRTNAYGVGSLCFYNNGTSSAGDFTTADEKMRIDSSGNLLVGTTDTDPADNNVTGTAISSGGRISVNQAGSALYVGRTNDGTLVTFFESGTPEGSISVSGTTVSYNGGHLARYSQLLNNQRDEAIVKGTVLSNLDQMCEWLDAEGNPLPNEQLNRMKVSDVEGDTNVAGAFVNWDNDDQDNLYDMNIAMTGDMIIRIAQGVTVARGDLLMSAGDGTAKPQGDDIVRSKTIAKVTSTHVTCTYADGSFCVPCVLMAC